MCSSDLLNSGTGEATIPNYPYNNYSVVFTTPDYCYFVMFMPDGYGANTFSPATGVAYRHIVATNFMNYNILLVRIPASVWASGPSGGIIGSFDPYYASSNPYYMWQGQALYFGS